jgi:hypothetical protein
MGPLLDQDGLAVAAADITPAYTSGVQAGTFSARTRRVKRSGESSATIGSMTSLSSSIKSSTSAPFLKRWLLHTISAPTIVAGGFSVTVAPQDLPGRGGGTLTGKVLLPKAAVTPSAATASSFRR